MICQKCSASNEEGSRFCYSCGAALTPSGTGAPGGGTPGGQTAQDRLTQNAAIMLAAKDARQVDVKNMRPLTRTAFNIVESERAALMSSVVNLSTIVLSLGMVGALIEIFERISLLIQSAATGSIEGGVRQFYATSEHAQGLFWLIVLFVLMSVTFVFCGRLSIRIKKVNRKKKRESMDSRL